MSTTYRVTAGDTFESIARKSYGIETKSTLISQANPGVLLPLIVGTVLIVPDDPAGPQDRIASTQSSSNTEVSIEINGERFRFWNQVRIIKSIDNMDTVDFGAPFEYDAPGFRETFKPFSFPLMRVSVGGAPFFSGTLVSIVPELTTDRKTINVSGYSSPGVLDDCTPPASAYPIEFEDQQLSAIATQLCRPFGIGVDITEDEGSTFKRVAMNPENTILPFLSDLAKQRNLVLTSSPHGELKITKSVAAGNPVARLRQGAAPLLSVTPSFAPQQYYSHITGIVPTKAGVAGSQYTVANDLFQGAIRPHAFKLPDTPEGSAESAVSAKIGRMFGNSVAYTIDVITWLDASGSLWEPNTTLLLEAPDAMIYNEYEFLIKSVAFDKQEDQETATMVLVLPGAYSGEIPGVLPWD